MSEGDPSVGPQGNVEIVRSLFDWFAEGEHQRPFDFYDPDIVWENFDPPPPGMEQVYRGYDGVRRFWRQWLESWERVEFEVERTIDGGNQVVVFAEMRATGETSGVEMQFRDYAQLWTLRDGKVVKDEVL
jgi:ketosteroid isomerase-like protein